jgi:P-type Ca2+ transporter type 2C
MGENAPALITLRIGTAMQKWHALRRPRNPRSGIFTRPVITLILVGGMWLALATLGLFFWALSTSRSTSEAMTMTFVALVLFEFVKAYNFRSGRARRTL